MRFGRILFRMAQTTPCFVLSIVMKTPNEFRSQDHWNRSESLRIDRTIEPAVSSFVLSRLICVWSTYILAENEQRKLQHHCSIICSRDWRYAVPVPYRTVPSRTETRRYRKKRSRAVRYGTVSLCCGTVRYAVLDSYTALPQNIYTESLEQNVLYTLLFMREVYVCSLFLNIKGIEMYQIVYS